MKVEAVEPGCWLIDDSILLRTVDHSPGQGRGLSVGPLLPGQQVAVGRYVVSADADGRHYDIRSELGQEVRVAGPSPQPLTTLILGGARSGKSREASSQPNASLDRMHCQQTGSAGGNYRINRRPGPVRLVALEIEKPRCNAVYPPRGRVEDLSAGVRRTLPRRHESF